ncbi:hypothetical protein V494_04942 [Pseudogymnoascus sp. VKM F-4513 (FW-928)]|nr:hypothetical protein V494_04942 [Pseudogymnoascus sp. VKM F-4513 (FW-928)]
MSVPVALKLVGPQKTDIVLLSDDMDLQTVLQTTYEAIREQIPPAFIEQFGGDMEHLESVYVEWATSDQNFPRRTDVTESNVAAVIKLLEVRRGVDVLRGTLRRSE